MKKVYMHTINGSPAKFSQHDGQIVYLSNRMRNVLRKSLKQIQNDQKKTIKNRKAWGCDDEKLRFGYICFFE